MNPCGHSDHEYNPYAERHECCDSRYCRCTCAGAKEREARYAKWAKRWKEDPVACLREHRVEYERAMEEYLS